MAEIFGATAGGAGLISLALQLGESAIKLKRLHNTIKEVPETVLVLSFDLKTVALTLQNLEKHRQHDDHDAALLKRCILRFERSARKISAILGKIEARIQAPRRMGRLYGAFKEQAVLKLLVELEQAKSSVMLSLQMYGYSGQLHQQVQKPAAFICSITSDNPDVGMDAASPTIVSEEQQSLVTVNSHERNARGVVAGRETFSEVKISGGRSPVRR